MVSTHDSDGEEMSLPYGKENFTTVSLAGNLYKSDAELLCPVSTSSALAIAELQAELRAYKLGKQKCSYNQVELVIKDIDCGGKVSELKVSEAIETCVGPEVDEQLRESCLKFNVRFVNNNRMNLYLFVVYATPGRTTRTEKNTVRYHWVPVTRSKCRKGCTGPVIRGLQRFGRMPRRGAGAAEGGEDSWKEPRHLYIAIDEASTHVCPRDETSKFRLLLAAYDDRQQLMGTTVSSSIRVLANNDAPLGAASFKLHCHIRGGWRSSSSAQFNSKADRSATCNRAPLQALLQNNSPTQSCSTSTHTSSEETHQAVESPTSVHQSFLATDQSSQQQVHPCSSKYRSKCSAWSEDMNSQRKQSLTELCDRLFETYGTKQDTVVTLKNVSNVLGTRKNRIGDVFNVLEVLEVVRHQARDSYMWLGYQQICHRLGELQTEMMSMSERRDCHVCRHTSGMREMQELGATEPTLIRIMSSNGRSSPDSVLPLKSMSLNCNEYNAQTSSRAVLYATERNDSEAKHLARNERMGENAVGQLTRKFLQLFLVDEGLLVGWDHAVRTVLHDGDIQHTVRVQLRRLLDIATILCALHLIRRIGSYNSSCCYEWLGARGVINHFMSRDAAGVRAEELKSRLTPPSVLCPTKRGRSSRAAVENCRRKRAKVSSGSDSEGVSECASKRTRQMPNRYLSSSSLRKEGLQTGVSLAPSTKSTAQGSKKQNHVSNPRTVRGNCEKRGNTDNIGKKPAPAGRKPQRPRSIEAHKSAAEDTSQVEAIQAQSNITRIAPDCQEHKTWKDRRQLTLVIPQLPKDLQHQIYSAAEPGKPGSAALAVQRLQPLGPWPWSASWQLWDCESCHLAPCRAFCHGHHGHDCQEHETPLPAFNPLFYLQMLFTPQQVAQMQSQNPAFLFNYVHYNRVYYHLFCAQTCSFNSTLVRPVAELGSVKADDILCQQHRNPLPLPDSPAAPPKIPSSISASPVWKRDRKEHGNCSEDLDLALVACTVSRGLGSVLY